MGRSSPSVILLLIFSGMASLILTLYISSQKRRIPEAKTLGLLMASVAFWCFTYMLELESAGLAAKLFWAKVKYLGIIVAPPTWLVLTLQYTGKEQWIRPRLFVLLSVMPLVNLALVWTGGFHNLYWTGAMVWKSGAFSVLALPMGSAFWVCASYNYLLISIGILLILQAYLRSNPLYRKQEATMLLAALAPLVGNIVFVAGWGPVPHLDLTPFAFTVTSMLCVWASLRLGLLDLLPIAHERVIDSISDSVIVLDRQNRVVESNPAARRLMGRTSAEIIGKPLQETLPELSERLDVSPQETSVVEDIELGKEAFRRIYELRLSPLLDRKAYQIGKVMVLRDMTSHRQAEEDVKRQNKFLGNVLESLTHPFYVLDAKDYTILLANSAAGERDPSGKTTCYALTHQKDRPCNDTGHPCPLEQVKRTKKPITLEHIHEQEDGPPRHFQVRGYPIFDPEGNVAQMIEYNLDITERRRMEEALRESEARLGAAIESLPFDFFVLDADGRYSMQNTTCRKRWGNIIGKRPEDIGVTRDNVAIWRSNNERAFRGETVHGEVRLTVGGRESYYFNIVAPIVDQGEVKGILGVNIDITERKRTEEALRENEARYRELSAHLEEKIKEKVAELRQTESLAAMGRMVSIVAHEVRNPLQNIGMGADLLKMALGANEETKEVVEEISYGVKALNKIIDELLNYSRPVQLEAIPVRVADLVEEAVGLVADRIGNTTLSVKVEQPEKPLLMDPMKFVQVLVNLLDNAADAMPDGGTLVIRSSEEVAEADSFTLSISDTGVGIGEEEMEKILEPFYTTKSRGTGLGLSICKKIIEAHGGALQLTSRLGHGTTAKIILPLQPSESVGNPRS